MNQILTDGDIIEFSPEIEGLFSIIKGMKKKLIIIALVFLFASVIFYPAVDIIIEDIIDRNLPAEEDHIRVVLVDYYMFFEEEHTITEGDLKIIEDKSQLRRALLMYDKVYKEDVFDIPEDGEKEGIVDKFVNSYKELVNSLLNFDLSQDKGSDLSLENDDNKIKAVFVKYYNFLDITGSKPQNLTYPHEETKNATVVYKNMQDISAFYGGDEKITATVVYTKPLEVPLLKLKISVIAGIILTLPLIGYFIGKEIYNRFKEKIKLPFSTFWLIIISVVILISFVIGALYAYFFMGPLFVQFLYSSASAAGAQATYSIYEFVSFIALLTLIFGLVFEMPVVNLILNRAGILKKEWLITYRKHVYVGIFIIAAIITPPDVISQIIVAIPMIIFYEISIVLVKIFGKNI